MDEMKDRLRRIIQNEALVFRENEVIIPKGQWLTDIRRIMFQPDVLSIFSELLFERYGISADSHPFQIAGPEIAGVPLVTGATLRAQDKGFNATGFFVRKSRKKTGLIRTIEGTLTDAPVILVDDVINRGGTLRRQVEILESLGKKVIGVFVFIRFREKKYYQYFHEKGIKVESIFSLDEFFDNKGKIIPLQDDRHLLERVTLHPRWYFKSGDPHLEKVIPKSTPVLGEDKIFMGSDQGVFWALHKKDGSLAWQYKTYHFGPQTSIFASPALCQGKVFFGDTGGGIHALDAESGKRLWVNREAEGVYGNILAVPEEGMVIVPIRKGLWGKDGGLVALRMQDGKQLWLVTFPSYSSGTPLYHRASGLAIVGTHAGRVHAFNVRTRKEQWYFQTDGAVNGAIAFDAENQSVLFASFDGKLYSVDLHTREEKWRFERDRFFYPGPVLYGDRVLAANYDKNLYCLDRKTGKRVWTYSTRARVFGVPVVWRDRVFIGANDARLHVVDMKTGKACGSFQSIERITNPVVIDEATETLYLTTYANELFALTVRFKGGGAGA